jgi:hypothetical protein
MKLKYSKDGYDTHFNLRELQEIEVKITSSK